MCDAERPGGLLRAVLAEMGTADEVPRGAVGLGVEPERGEHVEPLVFRRFVP